MEARRRGLLALFVIGLIACSGPEAAGGAACALDADCPGDQVCTAGACVGQGGGGSTEDTAPVVTITSPADGAVIQFGEVVLLSATVQDDRTPPEALEVSWESDRAGSLGDASVDASGVFTLETTRLLAGPHVLTARAMDEARHLATASVSVVIDGRPSAPSITLSPAAPITTDDLLVTLTADGVDLNRGAEALTYVYSWFLDGVLREDHVGATVPSTATVRGQTWEARVAAVDPYGPGDEATASVTVGNAVPSCGSAVMWPAAGDTDVSFTCLCSDRDDADVGDTVADTCTFMNGDEVVATVDAEAGSCLLDPALTERGMSLVCVYTPSDGTDAGEAADSAAAVVLNTPPSVSDVTLSPLEGTPCTAFTCSAVVEDADADAVELAITWTVSGEDAGVVGETLDGVALEPGDVIQCTVAASDGTTDDDGLVWTSPVASETAEVVAGGIACLPPTACDSGCTTAAECEDGTQCVGKPYNVPDTFGECVDTGPVPGENGACDLDTPCGEGLACLGEYAYGDGWCVAAWFAKTFESTESVAIPDADAAGVMTSTVACGLASVPVDVVAMLDLDHPRPEDLLVTLHDPNGDSAVLLDHAAEVPAFIAAGFSGDDSVNGVWSVSVADTVAGETGTLDGWVVYLLSRWD